MQSLAMWKNIEGKDLPRTTHRADPVDHVALARAEEDVSEQHVAQRHRRRVRRQRRRHVVGAAGRRRLQRYAPRHEPQLVCNATQ